MTVKKTAVHRDHARKVPTLSRLRDIDRAVSSSDVDIRGGWSRTRTAWTLAGSKTSWSTMSNGRSASWKSLQVESGLRR